MKTRVVVLQLLIALCVSTGRIAVAQDNSNFQPCTGPYALCAASTCTPTGNTIKVNGSNTKFPEADCLCPVFDGLSIADVNGGNMTGSCNPPSNGGVWSLYFPHLEIPQEITGWVAAEAPFLKCSKDLHQGDQQVNCFSFACDPPTIINGVMVATCHCPMGESPEGKKVPPPTTFVTQAGQGNTAFCSAHPVAGTLKNQ